MGVFQFATSAVILTCVGVVWLRRRQPSSLLFAALALYAVGGCIMSRALRTEFGVEAFDRSGSIFLAGTLFFVLCMDLAHRTFGAISSKPRGLTWDEATYDLHARNGLIFTLLGVLLLVLDRPDLSVAWNTVRLTSGPVTVLATLLLLMGMPACISALRTGRKIRIIVLFVTCSAAFVLSGSRALVMSSLLLAAWMLMQRVRHPLGQVLIIAIGLPFTFLVHALLRFFRGIGPDGLLTALDQGTLISDIGRYAFAADSSGGELAISRYFVFSTTVSSDREFGTLTTLKRLMTFLLPSIPGVFDKPMDVTYRLWSHALTAGMFNDVEELAFLHDSYQEGVLGSLHPTLFGEMFLTGGWWSLFISLALLSLVVTAIDRWLAKTDPITGLTLLGPVLAGYLFVARGNTMVGIGYFVYLFIIFQGFKLITKRWTTGTPHSPERQKEVVLK